MFGYAYFPAGVMTSEEVRALANRPADPGLVEPATPRVQIVAEAPPNPLASLDKAQILAAALRARRVLPGPIGAFVSSELSSWAELGFRLGGAGRIAGVVHAVMDLPYDPEPPLAA